MATYLTLPFIAALGLILAPGVSALPPLNENVLVELVLRRDPDLAILRIDNQIDSLQMREVASGWLPQIALESGVSQGLNDSKTDFSASADALQRVPGGGEVKGVALTNNDYQRVVVSAQQPLLAGAGKWGQQDYAIRVEKINREQLNLEHKKSLAAAVTAARRKYWDLVGAQHLMGISAAGSDYAREQLELERALFSVGDASAMDTLDAWTEYLKAQQVVFSDSVGWYNARADLALLLGVVPAEVTLQEQVNIEVDSLPQPQTLLEQSRQWDPDMDILALARDALILERGKIRNSLLPALSAALSYTYDSRNAERSFADNAVAQFLLRYELPTTSRRLAVARHDLLLERNSIEQQKAQQLLNVAVEELVRSWQLELRRIDIAAATLDAAQKAFEAAKAGQELGTIDRLEYLKVLNDMQSQRVGLLQRRLALKQLSLVVEEITGMVVQKLSVEVR